MARLDITSLYLPKFGRVCHVNLEEEAKYRAAPWHGTAPNEPRWTPDEPIPPTLENSDVGNSEVEPANEQDETQTEEPETVLSDAVPATDASTATDLPGGSEPTGSASEAVPKGARNKPKPK